MAIDTIGANFVGMQHIQNHNLKSAQSFTSKPEFDEEKSNASKLMLGATALAAVVGLGIAGYKGKLGKGVQKFLGETKKAATNTAGKSVNEPKLEVKSNKYTSLDWDAKPISRKQALFEEKYPERGRLFYINPEIDKEFEALRKKGYKINVKNLDGGKTEIEYIYPEKSPIKSKVIRGKVADLEKGYDWQANDTKSVTINLKENENSYTLHFNNKTKIGEAPYEFSTSEFDACGTPHWSDTGSLDKKDLLDSIITPWTKNGNSKTSARALSSAFKKELGL